MSEMADDDDISASDWMKGIVLSVLASIVGGASKLAIRKSWLIEQQPQQHTVNNNNNNNNADHYLCPEDEEEPSQQPQQGGSAVLPTTRYYLAVCLRLSGMIGMTFLNPLCSLLAMNYASPSILAPFSGLTLVWIILFSKPLVGEQPTIYQTLAACLIIVGEVIVAVFGDHTNDQHTSIHDIEESYTTKPALTIFYVLFLLWMLCCTSWICQITPVRLLQRIMILLLIRIPKRILSLLLLFPLSFLRRMILKTITRRRTTTASPTAATIHNPIPLSSPTNDNTTDLLSPHNNINHNTSSTRSRNLKRFAWGASGGSVTGIAQTFIKDSLTILKDVEKQIDDQTEQQSSSFWNNLTLFPWYTPLFVLLAISTCFGGLLLLTACMKRYDATFSAASFVGSFVISASIVSGIHYNTFQHLYKLYDKIFYPLGLCVLMLGVYVLVVIASESQGEEEGGGGLEGDGEVELEREEQAETTNQTNINNRSSGIIQREERSNGRGNETAVQAQKEQQQQIPQAGILTTGGSAADTTTVIETAISSDANNTVHATTTSPNSSSSTTTHRRIRSSTNPNSNNNNNKGRRRATYTMVQDDEDDDLELI